jgi:signal transduction histidine kinase/ActR/RegA family two-component response regulator
MKLRSQILIFLFLFGFAPLVVALAINVPLILGSLELFYHKAYLQNLRADFRDLDQHLASRIEMVRLLAKLPEPGVILNDDSKQNSDEVKTARIRYTTWINRLMQDQPDIIQILFLDDEGHKQFWLERDRETLELVPTAAPMDIPPPDQVQSAMHFKPGGVLTSPISINPLGTDTELSTHMTLRLISPIYPPPVTPYGYADTGPPLGAAVINLDIDGLARVYRNTYWVLDNGGYLPNSPLAHSGSSAFDDFPGLKEIFTKDKLALWENDRGQQIIWVPLFATERSGPLWVGRQVDPSPIAYFSHVLQVRTAIIVFVLIIAILLIARWFALRADRFGQDLITGVSRIVNSPKPVEFSWRGPQELQWLGQQLTRLSKTHAEHAAALRSHAQKLEESNRYKSQFLANVSHELRTPLNSILLLSKLLAESEPNASPLEQAKKAQIIHEAGSDLMTLIDDIIDLSRIEAGKFTFTFSEIDLGQLLHDLKDLFQPQFDVKGLALDLNISQDAPRIIVTDAHKVSQILKNFLANAVKFTERGGVLITLTSNANADGATYPVAISVSDTGVGIPQDKHDLVFEAFTQADGSTSRRYGGTGLGLSISRALAKRMGGIIKLQSELGVGSTFSLLLPLSIDHESSGEKRVSGEAASHDKRNLEVIPEAKFEEKRILVVDDDLHSLLAITPLLERWGLVVTAAGDGKEALETLEESDMFALVLMASSLPNMDGLQTIKLIRRQPRFQNLPIIALTANANPVDKGKYFEGGINDFLTKPIDPHELRQRLMDHISATGFSVLRN